jgi:hypothetical protein
MASINPYVDQIMQQTAMTEREVRAVRLSPITLDYAQSQGFDTVEAYQEAVHEFLNGM